ncbi:helix-turn-helix domain-containing protein [Streptomyces sp. NPDC126497]|uniref:helix-turn-helix domain-containing protein n=1 Tax=Streptomyces sp. NPDC126497 TaxID=3155313 RepID=UPI00332F482C
MKQTADARALAAALEGLKRRSGLTYRELGSRVFVSSSTLHRYCSGRAVPGDYSLVLRIARECGAGPEQLHEVLRCWEGATGRSRDPEPVRPDGDGEAPVQPSAAGRDPASASAGTVTGPPVRRRFAAVRLVLAAVLALAVLGTADAGSPSASRTAVKPIPAGAAGWARAPLPVAPELFGVTMNSFSGAMPSFRVGSLRLWDSETRWSQMEPRRGEFDWSVLDRLLDGAERQGLPTLFVFGGTPSWAAPGARKAAYPEGARAAPPDDLDDWSAFVRALVRHAGDRIDAYELWVMANHPHHYNGSVGTLVDMTRRASRIIQQEDADAAVVCPSVTDLWREEAHRYLLRFAELGGYQHCDAAGVKLFQRHVTDPPETMLEAVRRTERTFQRAGYRPPVWSTGTTQTLPLNDPLDADTAANYAVRFYLTGLYAQNRNLERMYFYAWGNGKVPVVVQAEGQKPTKAGLFVGRLQEWLAHARIRSCGHGRQAALPDNVWQCEFLVPDVRGVLRTARIRWTHLGTAEVPVGAGARRVEHLDGTVREVDARDGERITERPVLIRYG